MKTIKKYESAVAVYTINFAEFYSNLQTAYGSEFTLRQAYSYHAGISLDLGTLTLDECKAMYPANVKIVEKGEGTHAHHHVLAYINEDKPSITINDALIQARAAVTNSNKKLPIASQSTIKKIIMDNLYTYRNGQDVYNHVSDLVASL
jgi:hypothetical protein